VNIAGKGLAVLTACSHAGVINVLKHARNCFPGQIQTQL
jgi:7,8-dihydropterin-6-yl-methyl-4-(beta-D-ribofuranosyl)aminobenzene 5'-phosphate synthase